MVEGLDRVIDRRDEEPQGLALRTLERPDVDEDGEEQPEEQEVADGPADIRQAATEDEQREEPAAERGARDAPGRQKGQRPFHARGSAGPALGRAEPLGDPPRDVVALEGRDAVEDVAGGGVDAKVGADEVERARADRAVEAADLAQHTRDRRVAPRNLEHRVHELVLAELGARRHVIVAPGGRSRSTVSTASFPSMEAASTIPLDSIPMSFTGSRFATTTTFLPTSSAGA